MQNPQGIRNQTWPQNLWKQDSRARRGDLVAVRKARAWDLPTLGPPGFQEIVGTEGSTPGAASASRAGPASTATSCDQWPFHAEPL